METFVAEAPLAVAEVDMAVEEVDSTTSASHNANSMANMDIQFGTAITGSTPST